MRLLAVLAERLAVIGGDADHDVVPEVPAAEELEQPIGSSVGGAHIAVVAAGAVWRMRLEQMDPDEERRPRGFDPLRRARVTVVARRIDRA